MNTDLYLEWTVRIVDPLKTDSVESGSGRTPEQALERLRQHVGWKVDRATKEFDRLKEAIPVADA